MEILFIVLAFLLGLLIGAAVAYYLIRLAVKKKAEQMASAFVRPGSEYGDPLAMLRDFAEQLQERK